jgi:hypothetical protein
MIIDSEQDKKLLLHVLANFPMTGPYKQIGPAVKELDNLTYRVEQAVIAVSCNPKEKSPNE